MAITKQKKATIVDTATVSLTGAVAAVFVTFSKLTVAEVNSLRDALRTEGIRYTVVKKTLLKRALQAAGVSGDIPEMPGEIAVAVLEKGKGEDPSAPARTLNTFVKKFKEKLVFAGGVMNGVFMSKEETVTMASIPPVPVLRGMFVNVINSPVQRFALVLGEVAKIK